MLFAFFWYAVLWDTLSQILTKEDTFILLHGFIDKSNWFITHTTGSWN